MSIEHLGRTHIGVAACAASSFRQILRMSVTIATLGLAPLIGGLLRWRVLPLDFGGFPTAPGPSRPPLSLDRLRRDRQGWPGLAIAIAVGQGAEQ